jgi:hypothetical protein
VSTDLSFIINAAPPVILVISLNGLGWALRMTPKVPNWLIPLFLPVVGAVVWPQIGDYSPVILKAKMPWLLMSLYGFGLGWIAVGANQFVRQIMGHFWPETPTTPPATPSTPPTP